MHVALMEPNDRAATDQVAGLCAASGTSLHLIGPVGFDVDDLEGEEAGGQLDLWIHPDWFEFRRAITRERCYYFTPDGAKEIGEARLRSTSVLMFAGPDGLPERIKEKYPHRLYRLPAGDWTVAVRTVLGAALEKTGSTSALPGIEAVPVKKGRPRRRSGAKKKE